jgi:hypothetical protein
MADPNVGQIVAAVWEAVITDGPTDNVFTIQALLYLFGESGFKESVSGGRQFEATVEYATNTTFKSYGELETLDTTRIDVFDAARYDQKIFAGTVVFSDLEELRNAVENRKIDIIESKLKNGTNTAMEYLDAMLYLDGTGNSSKDLDGLAKIISSTPTTGTVGGINRATFPFWRNRQNSGAKTTNPYDNLRSTATTTFNQCSLGGTERTPTGVVSDRGTFEGYESILVNIERLYRADAKKDGDIAFINDAIAFKGKPWVYDEQAPANTAYFVNNQFLKLEYLKGGWLTMKDPVEPANQLARVHRVMTVANLITTASRHLGVLTSIS